MLRFPSPFLPASRVITRVSRRAVPVLCAVAFGIATGGALAKPDASLPDRDGGTPMASMDMTYLELSASERDTLFNTGNTADGVFRVIYSSAETGAGSPSGSWNFDQTVNVDYKSRTVQVNGTVTASNIDYFDRASDTFTYTNDMTYSDIDPSSNAVFTKSVTTTGNGTYSLQNSNSVTVHIQLNDQVGFMKDTVNVGTKAALINTTIAPLTSNPSGYDDRTNQLIQQQWRLLEPQ